MTRDELKKEISERIDNTIPAPDTQLDDDEIGSVGDAVEELLNELLDDAEEEEPAGASKT